MFEKLKKEIFKIYEEETEKDPHWNDLDPEKVQRNRLILFVVLYCLGMFIAKLM